MLNKILPIARAFISIKSTPDNPKALNEILDLALSKLKGYTTERFENNGVESALVYNSKKRPNKYKIILNGHLDVIPGKEYQYLPEIKNNKLFGVGSLDMKASAACLLTVFKEVANKVNYPLGLQLVTDEEVGGFNGTKHQIDKGVRADFVIAGEATNFNIVNKAKGILWVKIYVKGKTAHGAYPWKGENAIWKMNKFLELLEEKYPLLKKEKWGTTVNLSRIETNNQTFNKIPDNCAVWLDIRYVPEETNIIVNNIKKLLPKGFILEIVLKEPSLFVNQNNKYLKTLKKVGEQIIEKKVSFSEASGSSDARHFIRINCPGIEFGPNGGGIGSDNEWVSIKSLIQYHHILKNFLLSV